MNDAPIWCTDPMDINKSPKSINPALTIGLHDWSNSDAEAPTPAHIAALRLHERNPVK
jgi:hypothetical protein